MINITEVNVANEATEALVLEVIRSGRLAQGPMVERLEQGFGNLIGAEHVIAVNNGTTSVIAAIEGAGIGPGDEVITSPFTFVATLNAIIESGATARFADIGPDFNLDPERIEALIGPNTKAIMPVHLYGQCADMQRIMAIADAHDLVVIEDAAQAHLATFDGKHAGTFGIGCFSLYATKNMTTGEGGFVTTNDDALADRIRVLRNQGMRARYQYEVPGHNWRMTDLQAAVGIPQLDTIQGVTAARQKNASYLIDSLSSVAGITPPATHADRDHVWHQFTILVEPESGISRDDLQATLTEAQIASGMYYPKVVYDYDCYQQHPRVVPGDVPEAFSIASRSLSIPVHPNLSQTNLDSIADTIGDAVAVARDSG